MENVFKGGPAAPKDPTKKRPCFYIMKGKNVCGSPTPDGKGVVFIYESDGRLESSARLVGNITDEDMIALLGKTDTFKKLVHSIGVSVKKSGDPVNVGFAFQMYGKTDPYVSGTTLYFELPSDGMEMVLPLAECEWGDDDNIPGQIRFELPEAGIQAEVSVCFYLNDGYTAPEQKEDHPIDFNSDNYKAMIGKSLISKGNNHRIKKALEKARKGEETVVAFIGGSITQGAGAVPINTECYAYKTFEGFCALAGQKTDANVKYVKAGVGGTPSELGLMRYKMDVLDDGKITPDVVVIEYAVNDEGDETKGECYDSLARMIYNGPGKPAVILLYAVFANDWNLEERLCCVGESYKLPMVSVRQAVVDQFYLSREEGGVLSKNQFFYDCFHPTNAGHKIMADCLLNMIKAADEAECDAAMELDGIVPPKGAQFENVVFVDRKTIDGCDAVLSYDCGAFSDKTDVLQAVERNMDTHGTPEFPNNWHYLGKASDGAKAFSLKVNCNALFVVYMDSASIEVGKAEVYVDGEKTITIDPHIVGWTHANALIAMRGDETKVHDVEVRIPAEDEQKCFTILGFGICK